MPLTNLTLPQIEILEKFRRRTPSAPAAEELAAAYIANGPRGHYITVAEEVALVRKALGGEAPWRPKTIHDATVRLLRNLVDRGLHLFRPGKGWRLSNSFSTEQHTCERIFAILNGVLRRVKDASRRMQLEASCKPRTQIELRAFNEVQGALQDIDDALTELMERRRLRLAAFESFIAAYDANNGVYVGTQTPDEVKAAARKAKKEYLADET